MANIFPNQKELLELTDKMELRELNKANQGVTNGNSSYGLAQQPTLGSPSNQINLNQPHVYRGGQPQQPYRYLDNAKISKHRELPVDVPDSFVGMAKQSPRYPPPKPKPNRQISPPMPVNNLTTFSHPPSSKNYYSSNQQPVLPTAAQSTAANIINHNSSLRSSIKLKQLEKSKNNGHGNYPGQMQPAINQAFELNEDDDGMPALSQQNNHNNLIQNKIQNNQQQAQKIKHQVPDLCSIYNRLQRNLNGEFADITGDAKLAKLLSIYNIIINTHDKQFRVPILSSRFRTVLDAQGNEEQIIFKVSDLLYSAIHILRPREMTNDVAELLSILCKHEIEGVCSAFDRITQLFEFAKSSRPSTPEQTRLDDSIDRRIITNGHGDINFGGHHTMVNSEYGHNDVVQMDIENNLYHNNLHQMTDIDLNEGFHTKTVRIDKSSHQALGATIKNDGNSVVIGRIVCGGVAHRSGLLNEGDEILEVNGMPMRGKNINDVVDLIARMEGTLTFTLASPNYNKIPQRKPLEKNFVRAFFDFDGEKDDFIPCKELGLSFKKGEILAIIDRCDKTWWQAHREGDSEWRLAGLIPSIEYLTQRKNHLSSHNEVIPNYSTSKHEKKNIVSKLLNCPKSSSSKGKLPNMPFDPDKIPFYEEVYLYYPIKYCKRPIILVGPKMIGLKQIQEKLLVDSNRFAKGVSHTTRPMEKGERDKVSFHFVSLAQFKADINANKFIEYGLFHKHYYGITLEAMKEVIRSHKTCIQVVNTPTIFNLRQVRVGSELKPFFVFVKPDDNPDKLRNLVASLSEHKSSHIEENIKAINTEVQLIETHFLPYFDLVITISDVDRACLDLLYEIEKIESEPQWIPMSWQNSPSN